MSGKTASAVHIQPEFPAREHGSASVILSLIIPAFNEAAAIGRTLCELREAYPDAEIIVVDDGSTDATAEVAARCPGVSVVRHNRNRGYGASLKTALRHARGACVVWYDGDGQHRPADVAAVLAPVLAGTADAAIGVRGRDSAVQRERVAGKRVLGWVAWALTRERIPDLNSGLRCFRRDVLLRYLHLLPDRFSASTTSTLLMLKRGYRVAYVPIVVRPRVGTSTVRRVHDGLHTVHLIIRVVVLFEAFRVFVTLGLALLVPGLIYGLYVAFTRHLGFPTLAGTAVLSGLLTIFIGILADQVTELRKERLEVPLGESPPRAAGPCVPADDRGRGDVER